MSSEAFLSCLANDLVRESTFSRQILFSVAGSFSSVDVYNAQASLRAAAARCRTLLLEASGDPSGHTPMPFLVVPTVMHHYTAAELQAQEAQGDVSYNSHLGTFTNFVNLLGMCAVSVPFSNFEYPAPATEVRNYLLLLTTLSLLIHFILNHEIGFMHAWHALHERFAQPHVKGSFHSFHEIMLTQKCCRSSRGKPQGGSTGWSCRLIKQFMFVGSLFRG